MALVDTCNLLADGIALLLSSFVRCLWHRIAIIRIILLLAWIKDEKLFAFIPTQKDDKERWLSRSIEWMKTSKKATRKVVDIKRNLKNKEEIFNMRCLAFRTHFELFDKEWYLSIKPEWVFLWSDFRVSAIAYKKIQWLKKTERNMHVFNHFNFILRYLQPPASQLCLMSIEIIHF